MQLSIILKIVVFSLCPFFILISMAQAEKKLVKELGIVIFPSQECLEKAQLLNKEIAAKLPHLRNPSNEWHISLYHSAFSETYVTELKNIIATFPLTPIDLNFDRIYSTENRWINFGVNKNSNLIKLHNKVIKIASKYYQRELQRVRDVYHTLSDKKKTLIDKYGAHEILEDYQPHMTLFYQYPPNLKLDEVAREIAKTTRPIKCKAEKIALAELEYNSNISKVIYSVPFPK